MPTPYAYFQKQIVPLAEAKIGVMTHAFNYGTAYSRASAATGTTTNSRSTSSASRSTSTGSARPAAS